MLNSNRQYLANIFSTKLDAWNFIPSEVAEPNNIIGSINVNVDFIDTTRATLSLTPDNDGIEILLCGKFDYWYIDSFDQMPESDFMECLTTVTDNYDGCRNFKFSIILRFSYCHSIIVIRHCCQTFHKI